MARCAHDPQGIAKVACAEIACAEMAGAYVAGEITPSFRRTHCRAHCRDRPQPAVADGQLTNRGRGRKHLPLYRRPSCNGWDSTHCTSRTADPILHLPHCISHPSPIQQRAADPILHIPHCRSTMQIPPCRSHYAGPTLQTPPCRPHPAHTTLHIQLVAHRPRSERVQVRIPLVSRPSLCCSSRRSRLEYVSWKAWPGSDRSSRIAAPSSLVSCRAHAGRRGIRWDRMGLPLRRARSGVNDLWRCERLASPMRPHVRKAEQPNSQSF